MVRADSSPVGLSDHRCSASWIEHRMASLQLRRIHCQFGFGLCHRVSGPSHHDAHLTLRCGFKSTNAGSRRIIWFSAFVVGAFMSPPDPLSLFLVALPIIVLFEAALLFDAFRTT